MPVGLMSTYDLTTGVQLEVEDLIYVLSPFDVPLLGANGADGRTVLSQDSVTQKKVEWLDETLLTPRTTLGATYITADAYITVAAGDREKFQTGDVVVTRAEYMRVTGYGTTADTLLVTRAYSGTATNAGVTGDAVVGVGSALPEGSDPPNARTKDRANRFNYTEIFGPYAVQVSETENIVRKYGLPMSEFDYQIGNRTKEAMVAMEQAILYGVRIEDTTNEWRSMGGMIFYITTNVDSTTTDLTEAVLLDQLQTAFNAGGNPDRLITNPVQKRKISQFGSNNIRYVQDTNTRGQVVDYYDSDFGQITIVIDRWCRTQDVFLISRDQATVGTLRPLVFEMLAKTGDSIKGQVVGEKTLMFHRESWAARFSALQA